MLLWPNPQHNLIQWSFYLFVTSPISQKKILSQTPYYWWKLVLRAKVQCLYLTIFILIFRVTNVILPGKSEKSCFCENTLEFFKRLGKAELPKNSTVELSVGKITKILIYKTLGGSTSLLCEFLYFSLHLKKYKH